MQLTKNLNRDEFACQCGCGFNVADKELLELLQKACDHFKEEYQADKVFITITSGNRCGPHNKDEKGASHSKHVLGLAADHVVKVKVGEHVTVVPAEALANYYNALHPKKLGIGMYSNGRVHLDVRPFTARWDNR